MMHKLGTVTVGQSPRVDILPGMMEALGKDVAVIERGALDGLSQKDILSLSPDAEMVRLCTRVSTGTEVVVAKEKIIPKVQEKIDELNQEGVELILLLCTGEFPRFKSKCLVLEAQKLVDRSVEAVVNDQHKMGLVVPLKEQTEQARQSLRHITPHITVVNTSPYGAQDGLQGAALVLKNRDVDLIVMHCMGFTKEHRKVMRQVTGKPVIMANSIVARITGELLQA